MPSLIQQSRRRLLALVWNWLARPLSDVSLAYEEAEGRLHKALVAVFSPALFIYYLMFQNPEGTQPLAKCVNERVVIAHGARPPRSLAIHMPLRPSARARLRDAACRGRVGTVHKVRDHPRALGAA